MKIVIKPFPEQSYTEIINEVGKYRYAIFDKGELVPGSVFKQRLDLMNYNCVVAGTGCTTSIYSLSNPVTPATIQIPRDTPVIIVRLLRYDDSHGEPHYNADDQLIFASQDGSVWRLPRKDAPDHFIDIAGNAKLLSVADAYKLPEAKQGDVNQYSAKGAKLWVDLQSLSESGEAWG